MTDTKCELSWAPGKVVHKLAMKRQSMKPRMQQKALDAEDEDSIAPGDTTTPNLTFSQLCQEDKQKIGSLIRKLIDMKTERNQETENAKKEKERLDHELQTILSRNEKIEMQTNQLKTQFSTSLALLKIFKEKLNKKEEEKVERFQEANELQKELEKVRNELGELREAQQKSRQEVFEQEKYETEAKNCKESDSENPIAKTPPQNPRKSSHARRQNARLQRLLDIQNCSRKPIMLKRADNMTKMSQLQLPEDLSSQSVSSDDENSEHSIQETDETPSGVNMHSSRINQFDEMVVDKNERRSLSGCKTDSLDSVNKQFLVPESVTEELSDNEDEILIKELNGYRNGSQSQPQLVNDCHLLEMLENLIDGGEENVVSSNSSSDSEDDSLPTIALQLNRKPTEVYFYDDRSFLFFLLTMCWK